MEPVRDQMYYKYMQLQNGIANSLETTTLNTKDKRLVHLWRRTLKTTNIQTFEEFQLINDFLYYLWHCTKMGELKEPFNRPPPSQTGNVINLKHLLPSQDEDDEESQQRPQPQSSNTHTTNNGHHHNNSSHHNKRYAEIFERSPDKGAFLISQPVPRCGAFCYLAVINRPPKKQ